MRVWWTEGRKWKTWLLTARLCSRRKGSSTTPSLTGNVRRSSSLAVPEAKGALFFKGQTQHLLKIKQLLTWRGRKRCHIWLHVGRKRRLHILVWRQIWRNTTSWGHRWCRVSRDRRVGIVPRPGGLLKAENVETFKIC